MPMYLRGGTVTLDRQVGDLRDLDGVVLEALVLRDEGLFGDELRRREVGRARVLRGVLDRTPCPILLVSAA